MAQKKKEQKGRLSAVRSNDLLCESEILKEAASIIRKFPSDNSVLREQLEIIYNSAIRINEYA